jgi:hypothetical protein
MVVPSAVTIAAWWLSMVRSTLPSMRRMERAGMTMSMSGASVAAGAHGKAMAVSGFLGHDAGCNAQVDAGEDLLCLISGRCRQHSRLKGHGSRLSPPPQPAGRGSPLQGLLRACRSR